MTAVAAAALVNVSYLAVSRNTGDSNRLVKRILVVCVSLARIQNKTTEKV